MLKITGNRGVGLLQKYFDKSVTTTEQWFYNKTDSETFDDYLWNALDDISIDTATSERLYVSEHHSNI